MNNYSIALFLHITGALGFFVVLGLEWIGMSQIRSAKFPEEVHSILGVVKSTNRLGFLSMLTTVITGVYMMLTAWGGAAWILVVLGSLVVEILLFVALTMPRMKAVEQALAKENGPLSQTFYNLANHPILWISNQTRVAIVLGFILLKIAKPDLGGSLVIIGAAIVLGLASTPAVLRHGGVKERPAYISGMKSWLRSRIYKERKIPTRNVVAFFATASVAALVLLAVNSISASTTPSISITPDEYGVQTENTNGEPEAGSSNTPTQVAIPSPETASQEGLSILQTRCTQCHQLQSILQAKKTRTEWEKTLSLMKIFGLKISDSEENILLDYLGSESKQGKSK